MRIFAVVLALGILGPSAAAAQAPLGVLVFGGDGEISGMFLELRPDAGYSILLQGDREDDPDLHRGTYMVSGDLLTLLPDDGEPPMPWRIVGDTLMAEEDQDAGLDGVYWVWAGATLQEAMRWAEGQPNFVDLATGLAGARETAYEAGMRADLLNLTLPQAIHLLEHGTYATDVEALDFWKTEGVTVTIETADAHGWSATATFQGSSSVCAIAYGSAVNPLDADAPEGEVVCR